MPISRRGFFTQTFAKAAQNASKLVPNSVSNLLGIKEENKPLTAEEAAFSLANRRRKKMLQNLTADHSPHNTESNIEDTGGHNNS